MVKGMRLVMLLLLALCMGANAQMPLVAKQLIRGAVLRVASDVTGGIPMEAWKVRMARFSNETAVQAFANIGKLGGFKAYFAGLSARFVEGTFSGALLMAGKETMRIALEKIGTNPLVANLCSGMWGGLVQCVIMAPTTLLHSAAAATGQSTGKIFMDTLKKKGFMGLYVGGGALAARQVSNWAGRQGLTHLVRGHVMKLKPKHLRDKVWLTGEILSGILGGCLSCWNHPLEVIRIRRQCRSASGEVGMKGGLIRQIIDLVKEEGWAGATRGVSARMVQASWQTIFLVVGPRLLDTIKSPL